MGKPGFPISPPGGRVWEGAALPRTILFSSHWCAARAAWTAGVKGSANPGCGLRSAAWRRCSCWPTGGASSSCACCWARRLSDWRPPRPLHRLQQSGDGTAVTVLGAYCAQPAGPCRGARAVAGSSNGTASIGRGRAGVTVHTGGNPRACERGRFARVASQRARWSLRN